MEALLSSSAVELRTEDTGEDRDRAGLATAMMLP